MLDYDKEIERVSKRNFLIKMATECQRLADIETFPIIDPNIKHNEYTSDILNIYNKNRDNLITVRQQKRCKNCNFYSYQSTYRCINCHKNRKLIPLTSELPIDIYRLIFAFAKINPLTINNIFYNLVLPNYFYSGLSLVLNEHCACHVDLYVQYNEYTLDTGTTVNRRGVFYQGKPIIYFEHYYNNTTKEYKIFIGNKYDWMKCNWVGFIRVHNFMSKNIQEYCNNFETQHGITTPSKQQKQKIINEGVRDQFEKYMKYDLTFKICYLIALAHVYKDHNYDIEIPNFKALDVNDQNILNDLERFSNLLERRIRKIMDNY
jgi:hypothetical protein